MRVIDIHKNKNLNGVLKIEKQAEDGSWELYREEELNLVVSMASVILRDLMFGDGQIIDKVHFGDMGLSITDDLMQVDSPALTDVALANKLFEKVIDAKEKTLYDGYPSILYTCTLGRNEFNGNGSQLITEFALATGDQRIFTRKTRAGIYKDNETSFKLSWYLIFNG